MVERGQFPFRLAVDTGSAGIAGLAVSPIMTIIDKAVTESAAGHRSILDSVRVSIRSLCLTPGQFMLGRPFIAMFLLYFGTFSAANVSDTVFQQSPTTSASGDIQKLGAVVGINLCLSMYKDSVFARSFGDSMILRSLPAASYATFLIRDSITLFAVFNAPPSVAPMLPDSVEKHISRLTVAQLAVPAMSQFVVTPLHILGLDMHNRQKVSIKERIRVIQKAWWSSSVARALRVLPAFGAGNVVNTGFRRFLLNREEPYALQAGRYAHQDE